MNKYLFLGLERRIKTRGKEKEPPAWQSWPSLMFQPPRWLEPWAMILEENQNFWKKVLKRKKGVKIIVIFIWKQTVCKSLLCCCELFLKMKQRLSVVQQLTFNMFYLFLIFKIYVKYEYFSFQLNKLLMQKLS